MSALHARSFVNNTTNDPLTGPAARMRVFPSKSVAASSRADCLVTGIRSTGSRASGIMTVVAVTTTVKVTCPASRSAVFGTGILATHSLPGGHCRYGLPAVAQAFRPASVISRCPKTGAAAAQANRRASDAGTGLPNRYPRPMPQPSACRARARINQCVAVASPTANKALIHQARPTPLRTTPALCQRTNATPVSDAPAMMVTCSTNVATGSLCAVGITTAPNSLRASGTHGRG